MPRKDALNFEAIRQRLASSGGKQYWRSLDELAQTEEFREYLHQEFPEQAAMWTNTTSRRNFLKLMGASLALAGLTGCQGQPPEKIVPHVRLPERFIPDIPLLFATAMERQGFGMGLLVESYMGRPIKVEGNPNHPASLGATDTFAQASPLTLYDPDRSQVIRRGRAISNRQAFLDSLSAQLERHRDDGGAGLRVLTENVSSPTLANQLQRLREQFPSYEWHQYEPVFSDSGSEGARLAFGDGNQDVQMLYDLSQADVVLSLDADILTSEVSPIPYARSFMRRRRLAPDKLLSPQMNRLYVVEPTISLTGSKADHRWAMTSGQILTFAYTLAQRLGVAVEPPPGLPALNVPEEWLNALLDDLQNYRRQDDPGASLIVAGDYQPPVVHALAHAMNEALGNVGRTVFYREPALAHPSNQLESLRRLTQAMNDGEVRTLIIIGGNPVFTAPEDFDFAGALSKVPFRTHLSLYEDETSRLCHWHVPETHFLESWSDVRAFDGTATIIQPLITALYDGCMQRHEFVAALFGESNTSAYNIVRNYWREVASTDNFETFWRRSLNTGVVDGTESAPREVSLRTDLPTALAGAGSALDQSPATANADRFEVVFRPDPTIWDGRYANNGWLQELPKPLTKLTWDNAALISPDDAERLQLSNEDMVELRHDGRTVRVPVWVVAGHPRGVITLHFGYGRRRAGQTGTGTGFDVYRIRTSRSPWSASGVQLSKTGDSYRLATTQHHHLVEGRDIVLSGTLEEVSQNPQNPEFMEKQTGGHSLYPEWNYEKTYKWGMVIDQTACTGCSACVLACQAENNVPIVGKTEVLRNREMHWLRIDTYYKSGYESPETYFQPMLCVHCENAPCEPVCPVAATVHGDEGLNQMIYNRCIGTRYCSNNCPYKVRRFNFLHYTGYIDANQTLQLMQNPDVTVRSRGVMEKCTYCVQRISAARIEAKKEGRRIHAGEVVTACAQACPTDAILFGDLNNAQEEVAQLRDHPLNYGVLSELNTQPRTTYLAAIRNPNPRIQSVEHHGK